MSSDDDSAPRTKRGGKPTTKKQQKRAIARACDRCRQKKVKCDGASLAIGAVCQNCKAFDFTCTYIETSIKRGPPKAYVQSLEGRIEKLENLLNRIQPNIDLSSFAPSMSRSASVQSIPPSIVIADESDSMVLLDDIPPPPLDSEELIAKMEKMSLSQDRFFGRSSGYDIIQRTLLVRQEFIGDPPPESPPAVFWKSEPLAEAYIPKDPSQTVEEATPLVFPDGGLMAELTDCYFRRCNIFMPLLHRPTYERNIKEGLHLTDRLFGTIVIKAISLASRYMPNDERVQLPGGGHLSAGWMWFRQIQYLSTSLEPPKLADLQAICLTAQFLQATSAPQACWTLTSLGIRMAQDVGAHRKKPLPGKLTVEDELWKRCVWVLISLDRHASATLGRPTAIQDEDYDLPLPIECDDEHWEHEEPDKMFQQPANKPSLTSFFVWHLKLNRIMAFTLRTIYAINKSKILLGFIGPEWEQRIVMELDTAMNNWIESVPDHLRWDPERENLVFGDQSACLYASYYQLTILIHRPFIPSPRKPSPLSFPSLRICSNAAAACAHIVDAQNARTGLTHPKLQMAVFSAGMVLLLNIWGAQKAGIAENLKRSMEDVHKCMRTLDNSPGWLIAGQFYDILYELASVGDFPALEPVVVSKKRTRDSMMSSRLIPRAEKTSLRSVHARPRRPGPGQPPPKPSKQHRPREHLDLDAAFPSKHPRLEISTSGHLWNGQEDQWSTNTGSSSARPESTSSELANYDGRLRQRSAGVDYTPAPYYESDHVPVVEERVPFRDRHHGHDQEYRHPDTGGYDTHSSYPTQRRAHSAAQSAESWDNAPTFDDVRYWGTYNPNTNTDTRGYGH